MEDYGKKLENRSIIAQNGACRLWTGTVKKCKASNYGVLYCLVPPQNQWKQLYVHRLAYIFHHGLTLDAIRQDDMHVSHLCHNSLCIKPEHLAFEPDYVNAYRRTCVNLGHCSGHDYGNVTFPDCMLALKT